MKTLGQVIIALVLMGFVILIMDALHVPPGPDRVAKIILSQLYEAEPGDLLIYKYGESNGPDWEHLAVIVQRPSRELICLFQSSDPESFPYPREVENIAPQVFGVVRQNDPSLYLPHCTRVVQALARHFREMDLTHPATLPAEASSTGP